MILRFTDGNGHISFNTNWFTWNDLVEDDGDSDDGHTGAPGHPRFIEVSETDLAAIWGELNFNCYNYSVDLHHEFIPPDDEDEDCPSF